MTRITRCLLLAMLLLLVALPLHAQLPDGIVLQPVATGLNGSVAVRHAGDGSGRLFVVRQNGTISLILANGTVDTGAFLNIGSGGTSPPAGFTTGGERGLLGLAFHPSYAVNGRFFVYYTDGSGHTAVSEYRVSSSNPNRADASSGQAVIRIYQPFNNHNGGDIHFGPDGYLYIGLGDGGSGNDPCNSGQSLEPSTMNNSSSCPVSAAFLGTPPAGVPRGNVLSRALLGKLLRIDIDVETPRATPPTGADLCGADGATGIARYDIPADNPFAGNAGSNAAACDEIYHYGLRNPFRWSFDRQTGDLIIGDVGQVTWEEVNLVPPGGGRNFGWNPCEGFHVRGSESTLCSLAGRTNPIMAYDRDLGLSVAGGFRYRGPHPTLQGLLFFGDLNGALFAERPDGLGNWTQFPAARIDNNDQIVGFGESEGGTIYMVTLGGVIRSFGLPTPMPGHLTVNKFAQLTTDNGVSGLADPGDVITYTVNALNTGGEALSNLVITDSLEGGTPVALNCTPLTLAPNASATCATYTHVVTQAEFELGGVLTNEVLGVADDVSGDDITGGASASVAIAPPSPELLVLKSATIAPDGAQTGFAEAGEVITYSVQVFNAGNVTLDTLEVEDTPLGGATTLLDCAPTTLAPGATATCDSYATTVTQDQVEAQQPIVNTARATALDSGDDPVSDEGTVSIDVIPAIARLEVTKTAVLTNDAGSLGAGDLAEVIAYSVSVSNTGTVRLAGVQVTDQFGAAPATTLTCPQSTLEVGASMTCSPYQHVVTQADIDAGGVLSNTASVVATRVGGGAPTNASDTVGVAVAAAAPAITLAKAAALDDADADADGYADAGETIAYTFTVTNTGNVTLSGVAVQDAMLGGAVACTPTLLAPQAQASCGPVDYTVTAADMLEASIDNVATASGLPARPASPITSTPASTSTPVDPGPLVFRNGFESN